MKKKIELLAPAGGIEQLIAAVENGADAVYIGGHSFNARKNATNFTDEELIEAIQYAHVRDVKIYVTMNTLLNDDELPKAIEYAKKIYLWGADALIIQDLGFGEILKEVLPDFPIHASTQATVYSLEGVLEYAKLGYKRVILARELSYDEIDYISKNSPIEIETFVHGALCMSYSGQCLLSSFNGGRSGNRGRCAQPCRLPMEVLEKNRDNYKSIKKQGYYLSPKDLKLVEHLPQILDANVTSIKIEGRMKSPEYTAIVTRIYRKYLDGAINGQKGNVDIRDEKDLIQIFNRGGFTSGYFEEKLGKRLITKDRPKHWGALVGTIKAYESKKDTIKMKLKEDLHIGDGIEVVNDELPGNVISFMIKNGQRVTSAKRNDTVVVGDIRGKVNEGDLVYRITKKSLMQEAQQTYKNSSKKSGIQMVFDAKLGKKPVLSIFADEKEVVVEGEDLVEKAINRPLSADVVEKQLKKTGSTPFEVEKLLMNIDDHVSMPVKALNSMRRDALEKLEETKQVKYPDRQVDEKEFELKQKLENEDKKQMISAFFYHFETNVLKKIDNVDIIYLPYKCVEENEFSYICEYLTNKNIKVILWLPAVIKGNYEKMVKSTIEKVSKESVNGIMIGNIGQLALVNEFIENIYGDYSLNIFNSASIEAINHYGISGCMLSPELNLKQIENMEIDGIDIEALIYGRVSVMQSEHCPVGSEVSGRLHCNQCKDAEYGLSIEKNQVMPLYLESMDCRATLLSNSKVYVPEVIERLEEANVNVFRLSFFDESETEILQIIDSIYESMNNQLLRLELENVTDGHYYSGV